MWRRLLCTFVITFLITNSVIASDYVLPYPSYMPGHKLYTISKLFDLLKQYWYWGTIASIKYHTNISDKYLVEAKTLFEYKQYLLALQALDRSNDHFLKISPLLGLANKERKEIKEIVNSYHGEIFAQSKLLEELKQITPLEYLWTPEKKKSTQLFIRENLNAAIKLRVYLSE